MKIFLLAGAVLVLLALGGWWWRAGGTSPAAGAAPAAAVSFVAPDSLLLTAGGVIGAGGAQPLLARAAGRVRKLYFSGGEYVHQGDVLAKLYNYQYIVAPRDGFLGPCAIAVGQYLTAATPVTTLSRRRTLTVVVPPPASPRSGVRPGDSVRVWVAARPDRVVSGVVGPVMAGDSLEILLAPGAPFRIGERASVRRHPGPAVADAADAAPRRSPARAVDSAPARQHPRP